MQLFDQARKRAFCTSDDGPLVVGVSFVEENATAIGDTGLDLLALIDSSFLGGDLLGMPSKFPIVYPLGNIFLDPFSYRVLTHETIEVNLETDPTQLQVANHNSGRTILANQITFDPTNVGEAMEWAGIFGLDHLSEQQRERAIEIVNDAWGEDWSSHCVMPLDHYDTKWNAVLSEWHQPLWRDSHFFCPNPNDDCLKESGYKGNVPVAELELDDSATSLIFTYCKVCCTVNIETQAC